MAVICNTFTTWVTQEVIEPVEKFVKKSKERCKKAKWWNPLKWLCWLVWFLVAVTVWVTKEILVPLQQFICKITTSIIWLTLSPFLAAIDAIFGIHINSTVKKWMYYSNPKITFTEKKGPLPDGTFTYHFTCKCDEKRKTAINVNAFDDNQATKKAEKECNKSCGKI
ncbi:MAG: hypothetical protein ACPGVT_11305 [Maricaulaceae bacterium]